MTKQQQSERCRAIYRYPAPSVEVNFCRLPYGHSGPHWSNWSTKPFTWEDGDPVRVPVPGGQPDKDEPPCPICGNEERTGAGYLLCECPAGQPLSPPDAAKPWLPTPANINALPDPIRDYIHALQTRCDPSSELRELVIARETCKALAQRIAELEPPAVSLSPPDVEKLTNEAREYITAANDAQPCEFYDPDLAEDVRRGEDPLCAGCHFPKADHIIRRLLATFAPSVLADKEPK